MIVEKNSMNAYKAETEGGEQPEWRDSKRLIDTQRMRKMEWKCAYVKETKSS